MGKRVMQSLNNWVSLDSLATFVTYVFILCAGIAYLILT